MGFWEICIRMDCYTPEMLWYGVGKSDKNMTPSRKDKDMRKQPRLDMVLVWDHEVDISIKEIYNALFGNTLESIEDTQTMIFEWRI